MVVFGNVETHRGDWGGPGGSSRWGWSEMFPRFRCRIPTWRRPTAPSITRRGFTRRSPSRFRCPIPKQGRNPKFAQAQPPKIRRPRSVQSSGKSHAAAAERRSVRARRVADRSPRRRSPWAGNHTGGLAFNGVGGGDFGSRFSWYVEAVQRRISSNWLQSTIDPNVAAAPRVVVTFTILRDGSVTNIQVTQRSNNYSVDTSAVRAVQDSSPLQRCRRSIRDRA